MSGAIFAMPSFLSGAARTLDMFGTFDSYVECKDGVTADRRALFSDVVAVGEDWKRALTEWAAVNVPDRERQEQISR